MANKFLPFIVEKSPLHSIYQTMLSRSKGVHTLTLLSVFSIVGDHGIKTVREFVDLQTEEMSTDILYQKISNHFKHGINSEDYEAFLLLQNSMTLGQLTEGDKRFNEYGFSDILGFIYVLSTLKKTYDYFSVDYRIYLEQHSTALENLKQYITLVDKYPDIQVSVSNMEELKSHILFYSLIYLGDVKTIQFVRAESPKAKDEPEEEEEGVPF